MISYQDEYVTKEEYKEILLIESKMEYYNLNCFPRFINDLPNYISYRSTHFKRKESLHKGQYKLYLSEIDFLTDYATFDTLVIYVGAAPGHHINKLYDDFKKLNLKYHLYDTSLFDSNLQTHENITLFHEYFTDDHCKNYINNNNILFISDLRNTEASTSNTEKLIADDMLMQMKWVLAINPKASMLKFRLPYDSDNPVEYLDGEIRLQAYAAVSTNECRLVSIYPYNIKIYNPKDLEDRMYYLNRLVRKWYDYDNLLEEYIISKFNDLF